MITRSKMTVLLGWLSAAIAVASGVWMAQTMAHQFPKPSSWGFFLGLVAGTAFAVSAVIQFQRLNPLPLSSISEVFEPVRVRRAASSLFRFSGWACLAAAVGAFWVWVISDHPNWSWQLFLAFGLGLLSGSAANDWLEKGSEER